MNQYKYLKSIAYFIFPIFIIQFCINVAYALVDPNTSVTLYTFFNIAEILIYAVTAYGLHKRKDYSSYTLVGCISLSLIRNIVRILLDATQVGFGLFHIISIFALCVPFGGWILYTITYFDKHSIAEIRAEEAAQKEQVETEPISPKKFSFFFKSILLCLLITATYLLVNSFTGEINTLTRMALTGNRSLTIAQSELISSIGLSFSSFCYVGFALWLAMAFHRMNVVSLQNQGVKRHKKAGISVMIGLCSAVFVIAGAAILLLLFGCKITTNYISTRILINMLLSVFTYTGVAAIEEICARGILLGYCDSHDMKIWGILLSTFYFVSMHFITKTYNRFSHVVFLSAMALLYVALRFFFDNLYAAIAFHFLYDWFVERVLEIRILNTNDSFFSVQKLTYWKSAMSVTIPSLMLAAVFLVAYIMQKNKKKEQN